MKKSLILLAILSIATWATATTPTVVILSPIAVSSERINPWEGSSPMHLVAYATTSDCSSGISGMQVYTGDNELFYSTLSSYIDIYIPYDNTVTTITVKGWDNCGGTTVTGIFPYNSEQTGHVTVISPIPNVPYSQYGIPFIASATTTCAKGVSAVGVYTANHQRVATVQGSTMNQAINIPPGTYNAVVEEWDNCGGAATTSINLIVTDNGLSSPPLYAYMPDPAAGTTDAFWMTTGCQLNPVLGSPNPADWNPISVSTDYIGFVYVLNQASSTLSVYLADAQPLVGGLTQAPGSPFALKLPSGYTPSSVLAVYGVGETAVYVSSTSSSGSTIISEFNFDHSQETLTPISGSPLTLKGNVKTTELVLGSPSSNGPNTVFANNGSSISILTPGTSGALTEMSGSPFAVTGLQGKTIQIQDIAWLEGQSGQLIYTANSDNSISGYVVGSGKLTAVPGSPYANPDSPAGTSGNPTSVTVDTYHDELFGLDSGSGSLSVWNLNRSTGALTYQEAQQVGLIKSVVGDKIREMPDIPVDCMATSNGYGILVDYNTGATSLAPGSPVLNAEGHYPSLSLTFW